MAMRVKATVSGDKEIMANMKRAYNSVGGTFMDKLLRESLEPMAQATRDNAKPLRNYAGKYAGFPDPKTPRRGGHLDQGVKIARFAAKSRLSREYWVAFSKRARKIAHLVEYGTAPHFQPNFLGGFFHPGASPHPFFRPAFEETKHEVGKEIGERVWLQISSSLIGSLRR